MHLDIAQYDSFTDTVFGGNPAAVVVLPRWLDVATLQNIAAENNLSETAFLVAELPTGTVTPPSDAPAYHLKWFTPTTEIELCGHGTLAAAAHLFATAHPEAQRLEFWTLSGWLSVTRDGDLYTLDFPADHPAELPEADADAFAAALVIDRDHIVEIRKGSSKHVVVVDSPDLVRSVRPDFGKIADLVEHGIILTADASGDGSDHDIVSRCFAPGVGIDEDPVTGSAHTVVGPYWMDQLGRTSLSAFQASARGGRLELEQRDDRVLISGHVALYLTGTITVPDNHLN